MEAPAACLSTVTLAQRAVAMGGRLVEDHADFQLWRFPCFAVAGQFMCLARHRQVEYTLHIRSRVEIRRTSADIY